MPSAHRPGPGPRSEPLPEHVAPMLATAGEMPDDDTGWGFELKWDGVRAVAHGDPGGRLRLESRNLRDVTVAYPELADLGPVLADAGAVLDGEVVALDDAGRPSFQRLQERMHVADARAAAERAARVPVLYVVFDVLQVAGNRTIDLSYEERRAALDGLGLTGTSWAVPPWFKEEGALTHRVAEDRDLEGVVCKRLESRYVPGARSRQWRKVKILRSDEFVVGGWMPGEGRRGGGIGSLLLGSYDPEGRLRYRGGVGTGFTQADLARLEERLAPRRRATSPFTGPQPKRGAVFVDPELVAEVAYAERTREGVLRQPSFKGLRMDKSPSDVVEQRGVGVDGGQHAD